MPICNLSSASVVHDGFMFGWRRIRSKVSVCGGVGLDHDAEVQGDAFGFLRLAILCDSRWFRAARSSHSRDGKGLTSPRSWPTSAVTAGQSKCWPVTKGFVFTHGTCTPEDHTRAMSAPFDCVARRLDVRQAWRDHRGCAHYAVESLPQLRETVAKCRFVDHPHLCALTSRLHRRLISMRVVPIFPRLTQCGPGSIVPGQKPLGPAC